MIYNMRRRGKKQLTWRFNNSLNYKAYESSKTFSATFESAGKEFYKISLSFHPKQGLTQMQYVGLQAWSSVSAYTVIDGFKYKDYQTVTFKEPPTGELLAFLQQNATPL